MALDREKILQTAQKYVSKKKYDRAIAEYQKIVQEDPNDARTLLKIGDLQARMEAYAEAIATYDRVGEFYASQGFALKAIAVYKQIRELIKKHVPQLADRYGHIVPKLAEIYTQLGLTSDALAAYDEVATRLQRSGRDRDAIQIFRKMVSLDATNPLPHLRLAEACCRVQSVDDAIDSFASAAKLLIQLKRRDDALKVVERILHFREEPKYARLAAELYLERGKQQDGLQALAKLQLCFQADPKDLETLEVLSRAFVLIKQEPKAIEVKKEMARIARDQGRSDLFHRTIDYLLRVAPNDQQVQALARGLSSIAPESSESEVSVDDVEVIESTSIAPESIIPEVDVEEVDFDEQPLERQYVSTAPELEVEDLDIEEIEEPARRQVATMSPDVVVVDEGLEAAEELIDGESIDARAHARKAIVDAESFRGLRLYGKAVETLRIALEIDPRSIEIREKLRDVLAESGDRDGSIGEMITLAAIYLEIDDYQAAEAELHQVLELEPEHPTAIDMLQQLGAFSGQTEPEYVAEHAPYVGEYPSADEHTAPDPAPEAARGRYDSEAPLPSYDLEEVPASAAMDGRRRPETFDHVDDPFPEPDAPLPSFPLRADDGLEAHLSAERAARPAGGSSDVNPLDPAIPPQAGVPSAPTDTIEAVEEALDEAEFFASRGLYDDAKMILTDQLGRTPNHPLLLERLDEIEQALAPGGSGTRDRTDLEPEPLSDDHVFDIAASLDALDELEQATRSSRPPPTLEAAEEVDVDQVFAKFKEGVREQVSEQDSSTHYDLGVAYKEMGLIPDAVSEFEIASRDPKYECMCFAMIGMIHLEQGEVDQAAEAYIKGLSASQKTIDQEMNLYYDLGIVYEMKGSASEALYYFQKIARRDPGFRDVKDRISALTKSNGDHRERPRSLSDDDGFEAAFDDLFESK